MHWLYSTELVFGVAAQDKPSNAAFKSPGRHFHAINDCAKKETATENGKHCWSQLWHSHCDQEPATVPVFKADARHRR